MWKMQKAFQEVKSNAVPGISVQSQQTQALEQLEKKNEFLEIVDRNKVINTAFTFQAISQVCKKHFQEAISPPNAYLNLQNRLHLAS